LNSCLTWMGKDKTVLPIEAIIKNQTRIPKRIPTGKPHIYKNRKFWFGNKNILAQKHQTWTHRYSYSHNCSCSTSKILLIYLYTIRNRILKIFKVVLLIKKFATVYKQTKLLKIISVAVYWVLAKGLTIYRQFLLACLMIPTPQGQFQFLQRHSHGFPDLSGKRTWKGNSS